MPFLLNQSLTHKWCYIFLIIIETLSNEMGIYETDFTTLNFSDWYVWIHKTKLSMKLFHKF